MKNTTYVKKGKKIISLIVIIGLLLSFSSCSLIQNITNQFSSVSPKETNGTEGIAPTASENGTESWKTIFPELASQYSLDNVSAQPTEIEKLTYLDNIMFQDYVTSDSVSLHLTLKDPASMGISLEKPTLGVVDLESQAESFALVEKLAALANGIDSSALEAQDKIALDIMKYNLDLSLEYEKYYYFSSAFNSITGIQSQLPLVMAEYYFDKKTDVEDYLLLLEDIHRYYKDLMVFEEQRLAKGLSSTKTNIDKIIESCKTFLADKDSEDNLLISSFKDRINAVDFLSEEEKTTFIESNTQKLNEFVYPAYQLLIDQFTLLKEKAPEEEQGLANFEQGKEYFSWLMKKESSSDLTVDEIWDLMEKRTDEAISDIQNMSVPETFYDEFYATSFSKGDINQNLEYCKALILDAFPALPEHQVVIKNVPPSLEDFFSPAAYLTCRIDDPTYNLILANQKQLADYNQLLETVGHEGYPGHLYQNVYHSQKIKSLFQRVVSLKGYSEGWAEYAGFYVLKNSDFSQDMIKYGKLESDLINLILPTMVDIGVNHRGWTKVKVAEFLATYGLEATDLANYYFDKAIEIPGYYAAYAVGSILMHDIAASLESNAVENADQGKGKADLEMHQKLLDIGPAPYHILEKYLLEAEL